MSFLTPLFLLGGLAIALPIVFHLIRRTSRERMAFSSLMFLAPTPPRVTKRSRLEHLLLLLLRCLAVCILALGFARPFFPKPVNASPSPNEIKRTVVLIDASASMRRQNLWAQAKERAEQIIRKASPSDQVAVYIFDRTLRPIIAFEQWNAMNPGQRIASVVQQIETAQPSWLGTHFGNALTGAAEAFEQFGDAEIGLRQIILISDLQEGSRMDGLEGFEWPKGIELVLEPISAKDTSNAGLYLVEESESTLSSGTNVTLRIRVNNSSDSKIERFNIQWENAAGSETAQVYVPAGQSRVFSAPKQAAGASPESLLLTGDQDPFDNRVFVIPTKPQQLGVIYLGNDAPENPAEPLYYVQRAFQDTRHQDVNFLVRKMDATLSDAELENAQLLIVSSPLTDQHLKGTVERFLSKKRIVLFVGRDTISALNIGQVLGVPDLPVQEAEGKSYRMFGEIDFKHPLFASFSDPRFGDFTKIHIWKHRRIEAERIPTMRVVARLDDGTPAIVEAPKGAGSVIGFLFGWQPTDSQLALSTKFVPLLYSILNMAVDLSPQRNQYLVGNTISLNTSSTDSAAKIRKPDGAMVDYKSGDAFAAADVPGIYQLEAQQSPMRFAVNLDPAESKTAPLPIETLERYGLPLKKELRKTQKPTGETKENKLASELEQQQQLWRWLIVAALVFLIFETWLAGRTVQRLKSSAA